MSDDGARIRINRKGVIELLRSEEIAEDLERRAQAIAEAAGPGHRIEQELGTNRARAAVITDDIPAMLREAKSRNLTRAVDAGR